MKQKTPEILISAGGIAVLAAIFALWCSRAQYGVVGMTAAVIATVGFAAVCLRFVPVWVSAWRDGEPFLLSDDNSHPHLCVQIFTAVVLWVVMII